MSRSKRAHVSESDSESDENNEKKHNKKARVTSHSKEDIIAAVDTLHEYVSSHPGCKLIWKPKSIKKNNVYTHLSDTLHPHHPNLTKSTLVNLFGNLRGSKGKVATFITSLKPTIDNSIEQFTTHHLNELNSKLTHHDSSLSVLTFSKSFDKLVKNHIERGQINVTLEPHLPSEHALAEIMGELEEWRNPTTRASTLSHQLITQILKDIEALRKFIDQIHLSFSVLCSSICLFVCLMLVS